MNYYIGKIIYEATELLFVWYYLGHMVLAFHVLLILPPKVTSCPSLLTEN